MVESVAHPDSSGVALSETLTFLLGNGILFESEEFTGPLNHGPLIFLFRYRNAGVDLAGNGRCKRTGLEQASMRCTFCPLTGRLCFEQTKSEYLTLESREKITASDQKLALVRRYYYSRRRPSKSELRNDSPQTGTPVSHRAYVSVRVASSALT